MGKSILFIISILLTLLNYVISNHTDPLEVKVVANNTLKTITNKDLSSNHDHLPIEVELQEQNKSENSHIKPRKSAVAPKESTNVVDVVKIADPGKISTIKLSNNTMQKASETGVIVPAVVVPVHTEKLHVAREGIVESHNSSKILNNTNAQIPHNITTTTQKVNTTVITEPKSNNSTVILSPKPNSTMMTSTTITSTTTTAATTTTTTTKTTTTTTTTPKPKKPKITYSIEDMPSIAKIIPEKLSNKFPSEKLNVDEPEQPIAQPSQEFETSPMYHGRTDYIIPIVSLIFAVPIIMGAMIVAYRRMKDYWSTRHYRRMDFLVDGMYND